MRAPVNINILLNKFLQNFSPYMTNCPLEEEKNILAKLIYRSKNQHKSSFVLRMMIHLKRLFRTEHFSKEEKSKILNLCQNLYIECSRYVHMGYFLPFHITTMCIAARIYFLLSRSYKTQKKNQIDDIFSKISKTK